MTGRNDVPLRRALPTVIERKSKSLRSRLTWTLGPKTKRVVGIYYLNLLNHVVFRSSRPSSSSTMSPGAMSLSPRKKTIPDVPLYADIPWLAQSVLFPEFSQPRDSK